ncbi:MAG: hypothetical protein QOI15_1370 [Pseudonocardiales bacterium]|jgi:hypothetical protein|nr:hypothetical protein [Pseudonocardiales bacterium]MDT4920468.1 hypothetical protein [Pseudonocardiales bacterium]
MPEIDVVDSTWFAAPPATVAALIADPSNWRRWWPDLTLEVDEWRNDKGVRWLVPAVAGRGEGLAGSAEVWLEPMFEGVVAHFFLRLDPPPGRRLSQRRRERITDEFRRRTKATFWALADQLDPGRVARLTSAHQPGPPALPASSRATGGAYPGR